MNNLKNEIKNHILIKYAKKSLDKSSNKLSQDISWIKRKHLTNTIKTHCSVLLNSLINNDSQISFRKKKFLFDNILKYSFTKGENLLKANGSVKTIKPHLQVNSYIIYEEITKGIQDGKSKKTINFNIEKQMSKIQEKTTNQIDIETVLEEIKNI